LLLAVAFSAKVVTMVRADQAGRDAYGQGAFRDASDSFDANRAVNVLESWVSPYDDGTARYQLGDYVRAARLLQEALGVAPAEEACRVRINLALTYEAIGDSDLAEGAVPAARGRWQQAASALEEGGCLVTSRDPATTAGSASDEQSLTARTVDARLRDRLRETPAPPDSADPPPDTTAAELLAEVNEQAEKRRQKARQDQQDKEDEAASPSESADPNAATTYNW
jgi:tetratricopeptide (TPR) repeat protein